MTREIEIEDSKVQEDFKELGFFTAIRTIKKLDSSPSAFVRLATTHKELYEEHVYKRKPLCLFYQRFYAVQEIKPRQCWNCQGLGHLAFDCPKNEPTCMQCGDSHRVKECSNIDKENKTASKIFCSNCNQEGHTASARACPILKTHVKALIIEQKTKAIDQIKSNSTIQKKTYATTTKKSVIQNTAPNQVESEETAELKQIVSDLVKLVKSLLALVPNQITITETLRKIMNV
jgi:hypothetical protein